MPDRTLRLAVPNKGRLREPSLRLLREAGLSFEQNERALSVRVRNAGIELLFVRTEDVVELVADGTAGLGITGRDLLAEADRSGSKAAELLPLGFGRCTLSAAVPVQSESEQAADFAGLRIATSHPNLTAGYFAERRVEVEVVTMRGSVEVAPKLGVADAVADLVSTGSTLMVNGLRPVLTILESEAVLAGGAAEAAAVPNSSEAFAVRTALESVVAGRRRRYLLLNAPADAVETITDLIPGLEAPTVVPLAEEGMVAVHSVVERDEVWNLLPLLKEAGGRDILVLPVGQLVP